MDGWREPGGREGARERARDGEKYGREMHRAEEAVAGLGQLAAGHKSIDGCWLYQCVLRNTEAGSRNVGSIFWTSTAGVFIPKGGPLFLLADGYSVNTTFSAVSGPEAFLFSIVPLGRLN